MIIEENEKEKAAMAEFHKGNRKEGLRLQEEFAPSPGLPRTLCVGRSGQTNSSSPARRHPRTRRDRSAAGELENNLGECYL